MRQQDLARLMGYAEKIYLLSKLNLITESDAELCETFAVLQDISRDYASQLKAAIEALMAEPHEGGRP